MCDIVQGKDYISISICYCLFSFSCVNSVSLRVYTEPNLKKDVHLICKINRF